MSLVYALDCSNFQPANLTQMIALHQPTHVVVRLSTESATMRNHARTQLETAQAAGCSVSGYVWASWGVRPEGRALDALNVAEGYPLRRVWIDAEEGQPGLARVEDWLSRATAQLEVEGQQVGIYTGQPWWRANGNSHGFSRLALWIADWTGQATLDPPSLGWFGGWTELGGRQWDGGDSGVGLHHVGRDVFDSAVLEPVEPPDPCQALKAAVDVELETIDSAMAAMVDAVNRIRVLVEAR